MVGRAHDLLQCVYSLISTPYPGDLKLDPRAFADTYRFSRAIYTPVELLQPVCGNQQLYPGCAGFCGVCSRLPPLQHLSAAEQVEALGKVDEACKSNKLLLSMLEEEVKVRTVRPPSTHSTAAAQPSSTPIHHPPPRLLRHVTCVGYSPVAGGTCGLLRLVLPCVAGCARG